MWRFGVFSIASWRPAGAVLRFNLALLISLAVPLSAWADGGNSNRPVTDKWALVVGISKFADGSLNLRYPAKDAQDFYNYLVSKGNFAKDHVHLLLNERATKENILDQLGDSWLPRAALPDDLVVIFISSHGSSSDADIRGVNYVVAHDTNPTKLFTTGIPMQHLADTIRERVHSDRVLVVLDTCHAGGATSESKGLVRQANADAATIAQGSGQLVICSSDKNQTSWESKQYPNSVFTRSLIDGLQKQGGSSDVSDVFSFVKDKVQQEVVQERGVLQTPVLESSKWTGKDMIIACQPVKPRPGLPELPVSLPRDSEPVRTELPAVRNDLAMVRKESPVIRAEQPPVRIQQPIVRSEPVRQALPAVSDNSGNDRIRSVRDTTASEFLKYHFRAMAFKEYDIAWDDLAPAYTSKFQNKSAYITSISRHHWLSTSPPDSDFSVGPRQGDLVKVRVKMLKLAGYNATWLYTLRIQNGKWYIEAVGNAP